MHLQDTDRDEKARELRSRQSETEELLWAQLRNRGFQKRKFRRQRPIGPYFADFCCEELKLVVEIDGSSHDTEHAQKYDAERNEYMQQCGFTVLRIPADDVENHIDKVKDVLAKTIVKILAQPTIGHPSPSEERAEREKGRG